MTTPTDTDLKIVLRRKNRATGATIVVVDNRDGGYDGGTRDRGYVCVCTKHGDDRVFPGRRAARYAMAQSADWCSGCGSGAPSAAVLELRERVAAAQAHVQTLYGRSLAATGRSHSALVGATKRAQVRVDALNHELLRAEGSS